MVNFDPSRVALYETCQRLGVGITVMKAFGGGDLLSETLSPAGKALTPIQCLHYALTRPGVATVLAGARSVEELRGSIAYESASEEEKDYAATFSTFPNKELGEWVQIRQRDGSPQDKLVALPVKDPFHILRDFIKVVELYEKEGKAE